MALAIMILAITPALFFGVFLLITARKHRVGDDPHCPKCDYLLHGLATPTCPECGHPITESNIVRGERQTNRKALAMGLVFIAVPLLLASTIGLHLVRNFNWYQLRPTSWVLDDIASRDRRVDPFKAHREFHRRWRASGLSDAHQQRLARIALDEQAVAHQHPRPRAPSPILPDLLKDLGKLALENKLTPDQKKQFLENCARMEVKVRHVVVHGDIAPVQVSRHATSPTPPWYVRHEQTTVQIGDRKPINTPKGSYGSVSGVGAAGSTTFPIQSPPPGEHTVKASETFSVYVSDSGNFRTDKNPPLHTWTATATTTMKVIDKAPPDLIRPINDPTLAQAVKNSITIKQARLDPTRDTASVNLKFDNPPAPIAFEVFLKAGDHEFRVGEATVNKNNKSEIFASNQWPKDIPQNHATVTIILRPSEKLARWTVDLFEFWNSEFEFPNTPLIRSEK
jgi:hypothetical protein